MVVFDDRRQVESGEVADSDQVALGVRFHRAHVAACVQDGFAGVPDVGILAVDLEIGGDVPGKIHAVPVRPASPRHEHQVDIRVIEEKIKPAGEVQFVAVSELVVDMVIDGQDHRGEGKGLQRSVKAFDVVRRGHDKAFHRQFRLIRVLGPVDERHGAPGIPLAPFHRLLADVDLQRRRRLQGTVGLIENRMFGAAGRVRNI